MNKLPLVTLTPALQLSGGGRKADGPEKVRDAAQQFEALLLTEILHAARSNGGWLGGEDSAGDCATDFAEQQLATVLAQRGGLGLADLIAKGLERARQ